MAGKKLAAGAARMTLAKAGGEFLSCSDQTAFAPGDVLFVPAGVKHRFADFSADFATWVFFYGPEGGEAA